MRYAWDLQHTYLAESNLTRGFKSFLARALLHYLRMWDMRTAAGPERMIANSGYIQKRIAKVYRRESTVIFPPVDIEGLPFSAEKDDYYLAASRMVPYKRMALIVAAFARMPEKKLVVVGDGPEMPLIRRIATANVEITGYLDDDALRAKMARAKAYVFAAEEDFGIMPVEAQACGTPVIAYGRGGSLETVRGPEKDKPTGVFFHSQTEEAIVQAVRKFDAAAGAFTPDNCRDNAKRFARAKFRETFMAVVEEERRRFAEAAA
jgi:glycosyltransferase involved in cell wall biosynthesis